MEDNIVSLLKSIAMIILGLYLSANTSRFFYGLILGGLIYGIYSIYLIATHKKRMQKQEMMQEELNEQETFNSLQSAAVDDKAEIIHPVDSDPETATIIVNWFNTKMGAGSMPVTVNGVDAGVIRKDNLQVTYHTNVTLNLITMGIYKTMIELAPGDTAEYFIAGNGIRHERTIITRRPQTGD